MIYKILFQCIITLSHEIITTILKTIVNINTIMNFLTQTVEGMRNLWFLHKVRFSLSNIFTNHSLLIKLHMVKMYH